MLIMDATRVIVLVALLLLQTTNVRCQDNLTTGSADDGSSNRRRPLADPEHEHIGKENPSGGLYFDTADWSKEAEQWSFKGGDWGLVTLPDDDYPEIPEPDVPGPVLIAQGNSMKKVIVSRSLSGLENVSLHFSYYLTINPTSPPELKVIQVQEDRNDEVWSSDSDNGNTAYGQWSDGSVSVLPINGAFELKFIGHRKVDTNNIGLDDIVLRGTHSNNEFADGVLRDDNVTNDTSIVTQSGIDTYNNDTQVGDTTVSSGDSISQETTENNDTVSETNNQVSSNSNLTTESSLVNGTGTTDSVNFSNQSLTNAPANSTNAPVNSTNAPDNSKNTPDNSTNAPDNSTSKAAPNNATEITTNTPIPAENLTTLDTLGNNTDVVVDNTTAPGNDNATVSNISTATPINNETVVNNSTDAPHFVSSNATSASTFTNDTGSENSTAIPQNNSTNNPSNNIFTSPPSFNTTPFPLQNNTEPKQNITNPSVKSTTQLPFTQSNSSTFITGGVGGIEGTGSPPVDEASWGVFKILLTITVLGGCVLLFLYWRRRRNYDDEIALFSRSLHTDYHNPTFQDDISPDEQLTGRGNQYNYKSFN